jgi:hypothetical protein
MALSILTSSDLHLGQEPGVNHANSIRPFRNLRNIEICRKSMHDDDGQLTEDRIFDSWRLELSDIVHAVPEINSTTHATDIFDGGSDDASPLYLEWESIREAYEWEWPQ